MWYGKIKAYTSGHVYIIDDVDTNAPVKTVRGKAKVDPHAYKCDLIRELFTGDKGVTDYTVHSIRFDEGTTKAEFFESWKQELATRTSDDLLIIYYHGETGGEDEKYKWYVERRSMLGFSADVYTGNSPTAIRERSMRTNSSRWSQTVMRMQCSCWIAGFTTVSLTNGRLKVVIRS